MARQFLASVTRVSDLAAKPFEVRALERGRWATGDYVVCEVVGKSGPLYRIELASGRRTAVLPGDLVVGALGRRAATHECVGDWRDIGCDGRLHQLTGAGLFGKVTSNSSWSGRPMELVYRGHALRGEKLNIAAFVAPAASVEFALPVVLVTGSSMSAGKTLACRTIIHLLKELGYAVAAAKLTGAAGYKDALAYGDAGADRFFDYVDAGLVSTVCERDAYDAMLTSLLARITASGADVLVCELGASPREPYNGMAALRRLQPKIVALGLCASDAYAAHGVCETCDLKADFVTGPAANNAASAALVKELTGLPALDLSAESGVATLRAMLRDKLRRQRRPGRALVPGAGAPGES